MEAFIPTENIEKLQMFINKALRKGAKLGLTSFSLNITNEKELREFKDEKDKPYFIEYTKVVLDGAHPVFDGWKLIAVIELVPVLGSIAKVVPNEVLPEEYHNHNNTCSHCNSRRERKKNYIVQNVVSGEYKSVGSTCLKDFLGGKDAQSVIWLMGFISDMENIGSNFGGHMREQALYDLEEVLSVTAAVIERHGWTSKAIAAEYDKRPTVSYVFEHMFSYERDKEVFTITEDHINTAKAVVEYFKNIDNTKNSDYIANCKKFATYGVLNQTSFGLACSMVNSYMKQMNFERKESEKIIKSNLFYGVIGEKIDMKLTYVSSYAYNGFYGAGFFHHFEDEAGNDFVWSTSCNINADTNTIHRVKGTIKKHETYKDRNSTFLTRCKILRAE